ncbi:MAG: transposase [Nanoarchaeota archaeon]|nr:transposase [Nanoarchaeota archaeon]
MITYKFRIYPNKKQQRKILYQFKICKEIYNELLYQNKEYLITKKYDFNSIIKDIKITCPAYYSKVHSQALQNISDRVSKALENFFRRVKEKKEKVGFPRFKSRVKSITYPQSGFMINKKLKLSKIGNIPIIYHRTIKGKVKTLTIKVNKFNQWYVFFSCEAENKKIKNNRLHNAIGIDVGLENFATLSNGEKVENPRFLIRSEDKLKKLQRRLSRKKLRSKSRKKVKLKIARQHIKIFNQRNDFLHKLSRKLVNNYRLIAVEKLNIKGMVHNRYLAKHIYDVSWNRFIQLLSYKAVASGGLLIESTKTKGSSKRCSNCGFEMEMKLNKRVFKCDSCGLKLNRDHNAAINMLKDTVGHTEISTLADDNVRPSFLKAKIYEARTKRDELLMKQ